MSTDDKTRIYLEVGQKRVFASALDWPGWGRVGKTEALAMEALATYADRYAPVAKEAGVRFVAKAGKGFDVVERVPGSATTDYGVPAFAARADRNAFDTSEAQRMAKLVDAAWTVLDRVAAKAPAELRKGPRGGGRDRDKMLQHVVGAEVEAYARKLGLRIPTPAFDDTRAIRAARKALLEVLSSPFDGSPPEGKNWLPAYAARRIAWHALDHAWEMEDRSE